MNDKIRLLLIAAMCRNRGIGVNNNLPWKLKKEFAYYRAMTKSVRDPTKQNAIVMGRRTWESAKVRPMPGRLNVVITRKLDYSVPEGVFIASSLDDAISILERPEINAKIENVWILGGQAIYADALKSQFCHRVYLTCIDADYECDTFFPEFDIGEENGQFRDITNAKDGDERVPKGIQEEEGVTYEFKVFERV